MWYWKVIEGRRLIGHEGSVPGITTIMMANEQRNLGVIILTNGDIVRGDNQAKQVQQTINNIGSIHGVPTNFLESVFFSFNMAVWSKEHFW